VAHDHLADARYDVREVTVEVLAACELEATLVAVQDTLREPANDFYSGQSLAHDCAHESE
jgi:hypothetical protein